MATLSADREQRFQELAAAYLDAFDAGRGEEAGRLLLGQPDLADEITAFVAEQEQIARLAAPLRELVQPAPTPPLTREPTVPSAGELSPQALGRSFGDYELLEVIARGGMGVIYKAR